jgi:MFS transporter, DHA2 family, integral membrane protein
MATGLHEAAPVTAEHARRWWTLGVLCLSLSIVMVSNVSLNVALPTMARDLDASSSALQWIVDSYALVFAGMLFTAGTLGDRFGRKGALQGGLLLFLVAAVAGLIADTAGQVIAARAVMGLAAAFVMPSTLSILTNVFSPAERPRAIALWAGIAAGGAALGPPTSGFLLEHFWWGSVFLVNVPLVVVALVAGRRLVPRSKDPDSHPLDVPGAALSILGVGALVYAIIEAPHRGWASAPTTAAFGLAAVALAMFAARERTAAVPMIDLRLFRDRRFSVASAGIGLAFFTMFGTFFLITQYLQLVLGYSPLRAGLMFLPVSVTMVVVSPQAPKLVSRYGVARVVPAGFSLIVIGLLAVATLDTGSPLWRIYLAWIPMIVGLASTMSPLTSLIMSSVPAGRAGIGSAMNDTTRELGGALGVAVLGSVVTTVFTSSLDPKLGELPAAADRDEAHSGLAGALGVARGLAGDAGPALADAAKAAFLDGLTIAALTAAAVVTVAAISARRLLPRDAMVPRLNDDLAAERRTPEPVAGD